MVVCVVAARQIPALASGRRKFIHDPLRVSIGDHLVAKDAYGRSQPRVGPAVNLYPALYPHTLWTAEHDRPEGNEDEVHFQVAYPFKFYIEGRIDLRDPATGKFSTAQTGKVYEVTQKDVDKQMVVDVFLMGQARICMIEPTTPLARPNLSLAPDWVKQQNYPKTGGGRLFGG